MRIGIGLNKKKGGNVAPTDIIFSVPNYIDAAAPVGTITPNAVGDNPVNLYYRLIGAKTVGDFMHRTLIPDEIVVEAGDSTTEIIVDCPAAGLEYIYVYRGTETGVYTHIVAVLTNDVTPLVADVYGTMVEVGEGSTYAEAEALTVLQVIDSYTPDATPSIAENNVLDAVVGKFTTTDANGGTFTYTEAEGEGDTDNGSFLISGDLLLADELFDYETKSSYSVRVRATDSGGLWVEKAFTITITDVEEGEVPEGAIMKKDDDGYLRTRDGTGYILQKLTN